jgi:hypothetical protein
VVIPGRALLMPRFFSVAQCERWLRGVYDGKQEWTEDFGGEQFCLGRAFYTHLEEDREDDYFRDPEASDAIVERWAPGLQAAMRDLVLHVTKGRVVRRRGWCGPGVHVFPPGEPVAVRGGVSHFDTEGLATEHIARRLAAITVVAMFQPAATGGGLKVWDTLYAGRDHPTHAELAARSEVFEYCVGDVVVIDSYRLHQIQPFGGERERISATVHAAEVDAGLWETWF